MKNAKRLKGIRKAYPEQETFHETSDGHVFLKEEPAHGHASTLDDKTVTPITAKEIDETTISEESDTIVADEDTQTSDGSKIPDGTEIEEIAIADMNVKQLKAALDQAEVDYSKNAKKPELVKLLEDQVK